MDLNHCMLPLSATRCSPGGPLNTAGYYSRNPTRTYGMFLETCIVRLADLFVPYCSLFRITSVVFGLSYYYYILLRWNSLKKFNIYILGIQNYCSMPTTKGTRHLILVPGYLFSHSPPSPSQSYIPPVKLSVVGSLRTCFHWPLVALYVMVLNWSYLHARQAS